MREDLSDEIDCPSDVNVHDEVKVVEAEGVVVPVEDLGEWLARSFSILLSNK